MKKRIIPLFFLVLLLATVMIPTSAAISTKAISGKPTLKIEGRPPFGLMFIEAGFLRVLEAGGINQMRGFTRC